MRKIQLAAWAMLSAVTVLSPVGAGAESRLHTVSQYLVDALNAGDVDSIMDALSPRVRTGLDDEALSNAVSGCRVRVGRVERTSLPTSGTSKYAFFLAYAQEGIHDMVLELDESGKVLTWIISSGLTTGETLCFIGRTTSGPGADT